MLYFVCGSDFPKLRKYLRTLAEKFESAGNCSRVEITDDNFSEAAFNELVKTKSLFGQNFLVILKYLLENAALSDFLANNLKNCRNSSNIFVFQERLIGKTTREAVKKLADGFWEFSLPEQPPKGAGKDLFPLCDNLALRKKHDSWLLFNEAIAGGTDPEQIFWKIFWQIKTLLLVKKRGGENFKPYFYAKMKKTAALFTEGNLRERLAKLVALYHSSRHGASDLAIGLEKFILKI